MGGDPEGGPPPLDPEEEAGNIFFYATRGRRRANPNTCLVLKGLYLKVH